MAFQACVAVRGNGGMLAESSTVSSAMQPWPETQGKYFQSVCKSIRDQELNTVKAAY